MHIDLLSRWYTVQQLAPKIRRQKTMQTCGIVSHIDVIVFFSETAYKIVQAVWEMAFISVWTVCFTCIETRRPADDSVVKDTEENVYILSPHGEYLTDSFYVHFKKQKNYLWLCIECSDC